MQPINFRAAALWQVKLYPLRIYATHNGRVNTRPFCWNLITKNYCNGSQPPKQLRSRAQLISRNGNPFSSFSGLADTIAASVPHVKDAVLDGEIVCLNKRGHPQFNDLLLRRGEPCFFAFDLLWNAGKDYRRDALVDRKHELRRLLTKVSPPFRCDMPITSKGAGVALFERVCELDLEGIVARTGTHLMSRSASKHVV